MPSKKAQIVKPEITDLAIFGTDEQARAELLDIDVIIDTSEETVKEDIINTYVEKIDNDILVKQICWSRMKPILAKMDGTAFPKGTSFWCDYDSITVRIPWGAKHLSKARQVIGKGWEFSYKSDQSDGSITYHYGQQIQIPGLDALRSWSNDNKKHFTLNIVMSAEKLVAGSCTKVLVEERTQTYTSQVYKVVCDGVATFEEVGA